MDLSNLSSNLPPSRALEKVSLREMSKELTGEFKNAAKSVASLYSAKGGDPADVKAEFANAAKAVASLYRYSSNSNVLLMHKGYLECLDDLLDKISNAEDIENWALTKRAELTNMYKNKENKEIHAGSAVSPRDVLDTEQPSEFGFDFPVELASSLQFKPSFPPLSVTYKRKNRSEPRHRLKGTTYDASSSYSDESDYTDSSDELEVRKRRGSGSHHEACKRRKMGASSDAE